MAYDGDTRDHVTFSLRASPLRLDKDVSSHSEPTMHPCLHISELQRKIFELLLGDTVFFRRTLASLAATCKGLSENALDVLWASQSTLFPVLNVMPEGLWTLKQLKTGDRLTLVGSWAVNCELATELNPSFLPERFCQQIGTDLTTTLLASSDWYLTVNGRPRPESLH
jgi:hypothetical protein